ncbi:hypothetical protein DFP72DRAFT_846859 [Ephemerocybe angulata]|uniref:Uncharacterized protein n=1 Tax=Ephemerocybe angulata TaxID=980116 RepID=A0A8H6I1A3_9AGAR|nr:hypothetical protein DFP72DRAFT_846859 [Tulosesus angulatus]
MFAVARGAAAARVVRRGAGAGGLKPTADVLVFGGACVCRKLDLRAGGLRVCAKRLDGTDAARFVRFTVLAVARLREVPLVCGKRRKRSSSGDGCLDRKRVNGRGTADALLFGSAYVCGHLGCTSGRGAAASKHSPFRLGRLASGDDGDVRLARVRLTQFSRSPCTDAFHPWTTRYSAYGHLRGRDEGTLVIPGPKTSLSTPPFSAPFAHSFPAIRSSRSPSPSTRGIVAAFEMLFVINGRTTASTMMDLGFKIGSGDATSSKGRRLNTSPGTRSRRSRYKSGGADDGDAPQMDSGRVWDWGRGVEQRMGCRLN